MSTPRFFIRVGAWYKSTVGKSLTSDLEITAVVNDDNPNDPFVEDEGGGGTVSIPATAYASNAEAVAALGVGVLYKSTDTYEGSPYILITV